VAHVEAFCHTNKDHNDINQVAADLLWQPLLTTAAKNFTMTKTPKTRRPEIRKNDIDRMVVLMSS
jgi:hypothetical protein